jgi:hypothetical protein
VYQFGGTDILAIPACAKSLHRQECPMALTLATIISAIKLEHSRNTSRLKVGPAMPDIKAQ